MNRFPSSLPHGPLREIFPDIFFVTGAMRGEFAGALWQFSRNMTIVRDGDRLTLINSVRLDDDGLAQLDRLGVVAHVVRLGALHGRDDAFYVDRYGATYWSPPGAPPAGELRDGAPLVPGGALPLPGSELFAFQTTRLPEAILRLDRAGGILVTCDSLQNWAAPDEFFTDDTRRAMQDMGFFQPANLGPVWMQVNEPRADDFARLGQLQFLHVLPGHGAPLLNDARDVFAATFRRAFGV